DQPAIQTLNGGSLLASGGLVLRLHIDDGHGSSISNLTSAKAATAHQIDGVAAQPVAAFIVLAADALEAGLAQAAGERSPALLALVIRRKLRKDALEHPGTAEVQAG